MPKKFPLYRQHDAMDRNACPVRSYLLTHGGQVLRAELLGAGVAGTYPNRQRWGQSFGDFGGGREHWFSYSARCFKGNDLQCTVHRPSQVCSTQQDSDAWCRSGCELEWDCTDCNG